MTVYIYPQNLKATANLWLWCLRDFAIICVGPFNMIKGFVVSMITWLVYKRVSIIIHGVGAAKQVHA